MKGKRIKKRFQAYNKSNNKKQKLQKMLRGQHTIKKSNNNYEIMIHHRLTDYI